jgi:hypothetical protein
MPSYILKAGNMDLLFSSSARSWMVFVINQKQIANLSLKPNHPFLQIKSTNPAMAALPAVVCNFTPVACSNQVGMFPRSRPLICKESKSPFWV